MKFRAELHPSSLKKPIAHREKLLLIGSCFTEQIGKKLQAAKFKTLENPHGILFNPVSISKALQRYATSELYREDELFAFNDLWASPDHHTRFSDPVKERSLEKINFESSAAADFIKTCDRVIVTLGSAFAYHWREKEGSLLETVAGNCHKIPTDKFDRKLLSPPETETVLLDAINAVLAINPACRFIFTISPVRHLREGMIDNNRSKAVLIQAVHKLCERADCDYFPSYELIIDDLRDYRFFAEDLAHPNYAATDYVWEKFLQSAVEKSALPVIEKINEINAAMRHKPFNPGSKAHEVFRAKTLRQVQSLSEKHSYLNLERELEFFS